MSPEPEAWPDLVRPFAEALRSGRPAPDDAWAALAQRLYRAVDVWFRSNHIDLRDVESADVVQDVLAQLQDEGTMRRWITSDTPGAYVLAMARNLVRDRQRRRRTAATHLAPWEQDESGRTSPPAAESELESRREVALHRAMDLAMQQISIDERELLRRRYRRGQSIGEIASELGLSYSAAAQRIHRALIRVRQITNTILAESDK